VSIRSIALASFGVALAAAGAAEARDQIRIAQTVHGFPA